MERAKPLTLKELRIKFQKFLRTAEAGATPGERANAEAAARRLMAEHGLDPTKVPDKAIRESTARHANPARSKDAWNFANNALLRKLREEFTEAKAAKGKAKSGDEKVVKNLIGNIKKWVSDGDAHQSIANVNFKKAGAALVELKVAVGHGNWEATVKKCGFGLSRAKELMDIAQGKKTEEEVRSANNERQKRHRAKPKPETPLRNGDLKPETKPAPETKPETKLPDAQMPPTGANGHANGNGAAPDPVRYATDAEALLHNAEEALKLAKLSALPEFGPVGPALVAAVEAAAQAWTVLADQYRDRLLASETPDATEGKILN